MSWAGGRRYHAAISFGSRASTLITSSVRSGTIAMAGRKNPVMGGFVAQLTDEDIKELAEYYSGQRPGLSTARHASWFAQEGHDTKGK